MPIVSFLTEIKNLTNVTSLGSVFKDMNEERNTWLNAGLIHLSIFKVFRLKSKLFPWSLWNNMGAEMLGEEWAFPQPTGGGQRVAPLVQSGQSKTASRNIWGDLQQTPPPLEIPAIISDAAHKTVIFTLSSDPLFTAIEDRNHRALQKWIQESSNVTIPSVVNREDLKSLHKQPVGAGAGLGRGLQGNVTCSSQHCTLQSVKFPQELTLPIQHFLQQRCVPRHWERAACAPAAVPKDAH